ncbi:MAG: ComF family protein [Candidatus Komeilibacteria bacterium]
MKTVLKIILDFIFPLQCINCNAPNYNLCPKCESQIALRTKKQCPLCNKEQNNNDICQNCKPNTSLDKIIICADYENNILQKTIHAFKYKNVSSLCEPLSNLLIRRFKEEKTPQQFIIIPTPLHRKRQLERGFNQSELLAKVFAQKFNYQINTKILHRQRNNAHQADLNKKERLINIKNCFVIKDVDQIKNKNIILVDDVVTTGATLNEQAKLLRTAGAKKIWAIVLAKN